MRVLVTGGRDYADGENVGEWLADYAAQYDERLIVIEGGAPGADRLARKWCIDHGIHYATVPALWDTWGNSAGPRRNAAMALLRPEAVLAFPGGRGTRNMTELAERRGMKVINALAD